MKINFKNPNKKQLMQYHKWLRGIIQLFFFIIFPSAFSVAFSGVKYIFNQLGVIDYISITSFVATLLVLCGYTIVFGRFFCGFACSFGSLGDFLHSLYLKICKKFKFKPIKLKIKALMNIKYLVLLVIVLMCFCQTYSVSQGASPWDVFSMLHAFNFKLDKYIIGLIILIILLIPMAIEERFFCKVLCPMGAIFAILPTIPFFTLKRNRPNCLKGCSGCTRVCPSAIELPEDGSLQVSGDCFQCQKCIDICPKTNVHCGNKNLKGNEFAFTIFRALLLTGLFIWLGI